MAAKNTPLNPALLAEFHEKLNAWYGRHGRRSLPWRNTADPYAIYVSEIMLQQTQVATVLERFYLPFLARFPTLQALAAADQEEVLKSWQGLGYYNRAVNLHRTAKLISALPRRVEDLMALPGIGRNTAHAIAAFAHRAPVPVMEANVKRVLHRIFGAARLNEKALWDKARVLLNRNEAFDHNQAMMDLGALICTHRAPACRRCPAQTICAGKKEPECYPQAKQAKKTPVRRRNIYILRDQMGKIHAEPRKSRFLHGMYRFIEIEPSSRSTLETSARIVKLGHVTQVYSHFTLEAEVYLAEVASAMQGSGWFAPAEFRRLPHSKAEEKILALLEKFLDWPPAQP